MDAIPFLFFLSIAVSTSMAAATQVTDAGIDAGAGRRASRAFAWLKRNVLSRAKPAIRERRAQSEAGDGQSTPNLAGASLAELSVRLRDALAVFENPSGAARQDEPRRSAADLAAPGRGPDAADADPAPEKGRDALTRLADISLLNEETLMASHDEPQIDDRIPSSLVVFMHVTGGAGATTFAVNTACSLVGPRRNCCLLDLDVQFGGVASLLDLVPGPALQMLMEDPQRLERVALETMLVRHSSGIHVLTAPRVPIPLHGLKAAAIAELIRQAKTRFTYVVADLPVALTTWTDAVLRPARFVYLVTPLTVQAAHRTARLLHLMKQQDLADLPLKIVANRYNSASGGSIIGAKQFAKAIGRDVDHLIPNDYEMVLQSHNQGMPIVRMSPKSKYAQAIGRMLSDDLDEAPSNRPQHRFAGFDRM